MENKKIPYALLMNDVHVSKDNIPEFQKNWSEALEICVERKISELVIGGDLWQSRAAQTLSTLMAVRNVLITSESKGIIVTIAEGNHCKVDQESTDGYGHVFSEYPSVDVIHDWGCIGTDDMDLFVMSYFPENGSFTDRLEELQTSKEFVESDRYKVLYIHEGINGALATPAEKELPTSIFKAFDKVLVGHYHDRCCIPNTNIEYIGSSRQHNFGEDELKGYTILYSDGSTEFIQNKVNKRYRTLEINASEINEKTLQDIEAIKQDPLYMVKTKISCVGAEAERIDKDALLAIGVSKIDIISANTTLTPVASSAFENKLDKSGIKKEYLEYCEAKSVENVELGVKYLDKIQ